MPSEQIAITDRPRSDRYELEVDGELVGVLSYALGSGVITHRHAEVRPSRGRRGLGSQLARFALDDARARGLTVKPLCPFVAAFIVRHPEYEDLVAS